MSKPKHLPSSMSGGRPPTNTLREKRSPVSEACERGEEREGEVRGRPADRWRRGSPNPPSSSSRPSSMPRKVGLLPGGRFVGLFGEKLRTLVIRLPNYKSGRKTMHTFFC